MGMDFIRGLRDVEDDVVLPKYDMAAGKSDVDPPKYDMACYFSRVLGDFHYSFGRHGHHLDVPCDIHYVSAYIPYDTVVFAETSILTHAMSI